MLDKNRKQRWLNDPEVSSNIKEIIAEYPEDLSEDQVAVLFFLAIKKFQQNEIDIIEVSDLCEYLMGFNATYPLLKQPITGDIIMFADVAWYFEYDDQDADFVLTMIDKARNMKLPNNFE